MKTKTSRTKSHLIWGGALLLLVCVPVAYLAGRARAASIPAAAALTYSGVLTDAAGAAMTGSVPIQIALWDAATAGNQLCVTVSTPQTLIGGAFQVTLPEACTTAVHASADLWVEVLVSGLAIGRTKLGAVPYAVVAAESTCGTTTGPAMVDTGAGFCIDAADRGTETAYGSAVASCATEGKVVCSLVQLCTAKSRGVGAVGTTPYRVSDLMYYPANTSHYLGGGTGANGLVMPAACSTLSPPGPNNGLMNFRCCRGKG
jgi:hypothetical protein